MSDHRSSWVELPLSEVLELQRGHDLPSTERESGSVPIIGSFGITGTHSVSRYEGPGVAIGRSGASIGVATFVDGPYWPLNTCLFVKDFRGNDPRWVYRLLDSIDFASYNSGSAQPSLNRNFLTGIPVMVPALAVQRSIAEVLGALDDKIAANERVARLLQAVASTEFIKEQSKRQLSVSTFRDVASIEGGGTPSTSISEYWGGRIKWATPTDVTRLSSPYLTETSRTITESGFASCSSRLLPAGSILMTSRATIGAFAIAQSPTAVNQGFIVVNAKEPALQWWLYHDMKSRVAEFVSRANGATFLELPRRRFGEFAIRIPSVEVAREFAATVGPMHATSAQIASEMSQLRNTRDELLPLLMSGRVTVKDAERRVEDVI